MEQGQEQEQKPKFHKDGRRVGHPEDPERINVNGRWLTSYSDFFISMNFLALRHWQLVIAPDSEGDTCEQIMIPLGINGMRKFRGNGTDYLYMQMVAKLTPASFQKKHVTHYLTRLVDAEGRQDLVERGEADLERWDSVAENMGKMHRYGHNVPFQGRMDDGDGNGIPGDYSESV